MQFIYYMYMYYWPRQDFQLLDTYRYGPSFFSDAIKPTPPDLLAQLFWTATSLLESDFEGEFPWLVPMLFNLIVSLLLQIDEVWHDHVTTLSCDKSPSTAVNTYFLFNCLLSTRLERCVRW